MAENLTTPLPSPLNGLLERLLDEVEGDAPLDTDGPPPSPPPPEGPDQPDTPPPSPASAGTPTDNPLGLLLQNHALLSALPSLLENLSPLLGSLGGSGGVGSSPQATRPHSIDRHTALLCALKPYLSPHRRDTAETVIRLCRVWDALEKSGVSLTGLLGSVGGGATQTEGRDDGVQ